MEIARHWRLREQRYRLIGEECGNCETKIYPPRDICPNCGQPAQKKFEFSGKGTVYSSTVIYEAPAGFEKYAPYQEALVQLDEGPMMTARLTDLDNPTKEVPIGTEVEMVTREMKQDGDLGTIQYGPLFRVPIKPSSPTASGPQGPWPRREASTSSK